MNMNTAEARVVDKILTRHALGYTNDEMIGHLIFPEVTVPSRGARVMKFGKEHFRLYNMRRTPGADRQTVTFGYASDPVSVYQDALDALTPVELQEEAQNGPSVDLKAESVNMVLQTISLSSEVEVANLVRDPSNYKANNKVAFSGTDLWADEASDPKKIMDEAKEQIRKRVGRYPNLLTLSPKVAGALKNHPKIREHFKFGKDSGKNVNLEMLAGYFDLERVVEGKAVYLPDEAGDDADFQDVWGNDAILSYSPAKGNSYRVPAFGYTYLLKGGTFVRKGWFDNNKDSWRNPVNKEWRPYFTGADAGVLFQAPAG